MSDTTPTTASTQTTRIGRNWLFKTVLFLLLFLGFGIAGLADALYFYPRRGGLDASLKLGRYMQAAQAEGALIPGRLKCPDPRAELEQLRQRREDLARAVQAGGPDRKSAQTELSRLEWLESLALMWDLNARPKHVDTEPGPPARKIYFDPEHGDGFAVGTGVERTPLTPIDLLGKLATKLSTTNNPKPLSGFDMFFQWVFVVVGFIGATYMFVVLVRVVSRKYRWDPKEQRLTLPGGDSIVPDDIKEVDKRLWHKLYVTLHLKNGQSRTLDLLRYVPLEDWVLTMERTAFPDSAPPPPAPSEEEPATA